MAEKIDGQTIVNYLSDIGKKDSKGKIFFQRVLFDVKTTKVGVDIILDSPDTEPIVKKFKSEMIKVLMEEYKGLLQKTDRTLPKIGKVIRLKYNDKGIKFIDFEINEYPKKGRSGALPPKISEPATMLVLNAALESKGAKFKTEEDIFVNDVYKDLEKLFGKSWGHKLDEWIYTFLKQNQLFFDNYSSATWAPFKHKDYKKQRDPQVFFKEHLKNLEREPGVKAGTYEQWNPSDLYAVKTAQLRTLESDIKEASSSPNANTLLKLNADLITLMEKNELVGISLKKIQSGDKATFKIFNVEDSKLLSALKSFKALEKFDMKDIHFSLKNIFQNFYFKGAPAATTSIFFGGKEAASSKFKIDVTRSGDALVWNTNIPSSRGAQGGQTPRGVVIKLLSHQSPGVSFRNKYADYPKDAGEFMKILEKPNSSEYKTYHKWFHFCHKHPKNDYKSSVAFDQWADSVLEAYENRAKVGKTKLALLNFWYDALNHHSDDDEFWTDLLYFGLKITKKGQFAPHAKIS